MKLNSKVISISVFVVIMLMSMCVVSAHGSDLDNMSSQDFQEKLSTSTIYISPNGTGEGLSENDPANWNNAINKAGNGDIIQFANGTYTGIKGDYIGNIHLKGSGNSTIDANNAGGFFTTYGSVTLENLSFINAYTGEKVGNPDGNKTPYDGEGAIVNNGQLTVNNCYFASNQGIGTEGGAIHNSGTCYIYNSTFYGNGGKKGGAIYSDEGSNLYIYNSLVQRCVSREGSAVHAKEAYVEIHNCTVRDSSAKNGLFYVKKSTIYFYDSNFYNSKAVDAAGVINIDKESYVTVDRCIFDKISSTGTKLWFHDEYGSGDGGVIVVEKDAKNVVIKNSLFTNCTAKGYGGVLYIDSSASITIDNCTFKSNNATYGDNIYSARYASMLTIINSNFEVKSAIETSDIDYGESETIKITVNDGTNNLLNPTYTIFVNNQEYQLTNNMLTLSNLNVGNYTAILIGRDSNSNNYTFTQNSSLFIIGGDEIEVNVGYSFNEDNSLNIEVIDEYERPVANKYVTITIDNETYNGTTNSQGMLTIAPNLTVGNHSINVEIQGKIISNTTQTSLTVTNTTDVAISDEVSVSFSYNDDGSVNVEVKDKYNRLVKDCEVTIVINGISYTATTNDKGIAVINPNKNIAGEYEVSVKITGKNVTNSPKTIKVIPSVGISSIIVDDLKRAAGSSYDLKARLLDKNANPLQNKVVTIVINGNDYECISDEYGYVYLKNTLSEGVFKVTFENPSTGEKLTKNITIVKRITGNKDISIDYSYSGTYKIRLYADNGQVVGSGEKAVISINGKSTTVKSDKNGYVTFKISSLLPKTYTITAKYKNVKVSNKIVIKQILKAKNMIYKRYKVKKYTATLKTSSGIAIKNKKVTFKINGKIYNGKTNKKGIVTVNIKNLNKIGKHKISINYLKTSIIKTITIKR